MIAVTFCIQNLIQLNANLLITALIKTEAGEDDRSLLFFFISYRSLALLHAFKKRDNEKGFSK